MGGNVGNKVHIVTYFVTLAAPYITSQIPRVQLHEQQLIVCSGCFTGYLLMPPTENKEFSEACSFVCTNK
jgi:hypothetical protein